MILGTLTDIEQYELEFGRPRLDLRAKADRLFNKSDVSRFELNTRLLVFFINPESSEDLQQVQTREN